MRFKIDENLHSDVCLLLEERGHDVETVYSEGLPGCDDATLAQHCAAQSRALITLDLDFADIATYPPRSGPGFIVLRVVVQSKLHVEAALSQVLGLLDSEPLTGHLWVVSEGGVRIRSS